MLKDYIKINIEKIKELKNYNNERFKKQSWQFLADKYIINEEVYQKEEISRQDIIECFKRFYKNEVEYQTPFLMAMIWGFANAGYGPYRTKNYLMIDDTNENNVNNELFKKGFEEINKKDIESAFNTFKKVNNLGISFFSKLLYFASKAKEIERYPLILDIRVCRSLVKNSTRDNDIIEIMDVTPKGNWNTYKNYNDMIHDYANEYHVDADKIELFLFNNG